MIQMITITALLRLLMSIIGNNPSIPLPSSFISEVDNKVVMPETRTIYKTNSWMSSLYEFPSQPVYALPSSYKFTPQGIEISSKDPIVSERSIIQGHTPICTFIPGGGINSSNVEEYGDWNVVVQVDDIKGNKWNVYIAQGSPEVYISGNEDMQFVCPSAQEVEIDNGFIYRTSDREFIVQSIGNEHRVITLPLNEDNREKIIDRPWSKITNTYISWNKDGNDWVTSYHWETDSGKLPLSTIWPHHKTNMELLEKETLGIYNTHLGPLELHELDKLTTKVPTIELPDEFVNVKDAQRREEIIQLLDQDARQLITEQPSEGVYFRGTWLGKLTTLVQLTKEYELDELHESLLSVLETELNKSAEKFSYDDELSMWVYDNAEFGHEEGNDHHFHYGYYLRAMAVLIDEKPRLKSKFITLGNEMILDIANTDRKSDRYPFLRSYSPYEGHSWADGNADFGDGNNQESTSEALNAWYGVYLWGDKTGQKDIKELGSWLFSQELEGTRAYWFGDGNPFPSEYGHSLSSLVWGGKRDFATWFSGELMHIYGIELLPITPASEYLSLITNADEHIAEMSRELENSAHEWEDLYIVYKSFHKPEEALMDLPTIQQFKGSLLKSLVYHTVYKSAEK